MIRTGDVVVDEATYTAKLSGRALDLTFKEFELLKFLAQHPGRVFTREQLLQEVWGYDYFGGTRTVDVHVRRLRAKLGPEHESLIGTVRNVGYRFVLPDQGQGDEDRRTAPDRRDRQSRGHWREVAEPDRPPVGRPRAVERRRSSAAARTEDVAPIADAAEAADGGRPLDEAACWPHRRRRARAWVERRRFAPGDDGDAARLVVHPDGARPGPRHALLGAPSSAEAAGLARGRTATTRPRAAGRRPRFEKVRELWVMRRPTSQSAPTSRCPTASGPRLPAPTTRRAGAGQRRAPSPPTPSRADGRRRPRASGWPSRGSTRPGLLVAARGRSCSASTGPSGTPPDRRGLRRRDRPRRPGPRARQALTRPGCATSPSRGFEEVLLYVEADNERAVRSTRGSASRTGRGHPRDVPPHVRRPPPALETG